jgi:signal transduction histidine kinase
MQIVLTDRLFNRLILAVMAIGFVALMAAGGTTVWAVNRNRVFSDWVDHTYQVERQLASVRILVERAEAARRGYLLVPQNNFANIYRQTTAALVPTVDQVAALTRDNANQQRRIAHLRPLVSHQLATWEQTFANHAVRSDAIDAFRGDGSVETTNAIRRLTGDMATEENRLLEARREEQLTGGTTLSAVLWLTGLLLLVVAAGSLWIIRRYTGALTRTQSELFKLNTNLEGAVAERTTDLTRANDEIQRFAYIVSHDLRSPLVNVMGYTSELAAISPTLLELLEAAEAKAPGIVTADAQLAVREDLPEAIGFIRSSTEKMDRLINAILRLSREGRRTIAPQHIDVEELLSGIRDSMQHGLVERGVEVNIERPLPSIVSDRLALEQIFSNLIENAVKYLKDGRPGIVTIRGHVDGRKVVYEVEDNGRGIDPRDHERIFDLFRRSGPQDQPGEGIGLAHVRALAYRLGGVVDCDAALDRGATFRLSLRGTLADNQERLT